MHEDLVPPESLEGFSDREIVHFKTEFDVVTGLGELGHEVRPLGVHSDLGVIRDAILDWRPHVAFNLLEEFHGVAVYDQHVISYLELMRQPYTGCNPRGLLLAHDKGLAKQILAYHRIRVADFAVFPRGRKVRLPKRLRFPLFVKSLTEHGSFGIAQASVVHTEDELLERVEYLHDQLGIAAMAEEYVEGRELYVGILGNRRLRVLPVMELDFGDLAETGYPIATSKVKWDWEYQRKHGIDSKEAKGLDPDLEARLARLGKRVYRALSVSGYARIDIRLRPDGELYVLEANPNPDLAYGEELSTAAEAAGIEYNQLVQLILRLGYRYEAEWRGV
jgi:D-alanine-D-alanine ligase